LALSVHLLGEQIASPHPLSYPWILLSSRRTCWNVTFLKIKEVILLLLGTGCGFLSNFYFMLPREVEGGILCLCDGELGEMRCSWDQMHPTGVPKLTEDFHLALSVHRSPDAVERDLS